MQFWRVREQSPEMIKEATERRRPVSSGMKYAKGLKQR
jgi:hypothetical protein